MAVIIFFLPLAFFIFNYGHYDRLYTDNGVYSILDKQDVKEMTYRVYDFFKYQGDLEGQIRYADPTMSSVAFFDENEIGHMKDVRSLLKNIFILFLASLSVFLILLISIIITDRENSIKRVGQVFLWPSSAIIIIFGLLFILSTNFSSLFDNFHLIFFPQGNYLFPQGSLLITMFPFGFFYQFFIRLAISSSIIAAGIFVLGIVLVLIGNRRKS